MILESIVAGVALGMFVLSIISVVHVIKYWREI